MKNTLTSFFIFLMAVGLFSMSAFAQSRGTKEEAVSLANKTIVDIRKQGLETIIKKINDHHDKTYKNKDLYVFIVTTDDKGTFLAHGYKALLIGKDLINLKDVKGTPLVQDFIHIANSKKGDGWVDYYWPHPTTKKTAAKTSYIKKGDGEYLIGVGVYK